MYIYIFHIYICTYVDPSSLPILPLMNMQVVSISRLL